MHLSDYQIAAYIDKKLTKEDNAKIREHINGCEKCFEKAFFLKKALIEEKRILQKEKNSLFDIIKTKIKIVKDGLELIKGVPIIKETSFAFRNRPVLKGIKIDTEIPINIFYDECIKISADNDINIEVKTEKKLIFKGFLPGGVDIKIEKDEINSKFIIIFNKNRIEFEINV
ncbi:MAG TPA: zf-HC2 domain-containing protein [Spirochaetota bacterium]|nr:zf-HC2 domain-containing protein [Spirochaetota bacterium]HOM39242.1 zf-HC2 domain-containing protein [Spirochaetota bacterium]HPQ48649.1 zf-HC2 domain-containing protein [Spirochaetota bacterium]